MDIVKVIYGDSQFNNQKQVEYFIQEVKIKN